MYELNGIVYAGDPVPMLTIKMVRPIENYTLLLRFSTGEEKTFDMSPLLKEPAFNILQDVTVFNSAYIDYGTVVWNNGTIDIDPEYLYEAGTSLNPVLSL
ncbi:MAG: DUF2442 domain-containing protein [Treponema sp.]|nr:DUF2442 domain-containing protein [Treponema sp.]